MSSHWSLANTNKLVVSSSAEELWEAAISYFKWCDDNPIKVKKSLTAGKSAGTKIEEEHPRPYTIKGLCLHCGILEEYLREVRNQKKKDSLYYIVVSKILYIIYIQNQELATVGVFNPIFVTRVLNMDKDDTPPSSIKVTVVGGLPSLAKSEDEVLEKLDSENSLFETGGLENSERQMENRNRELGQ